MSSIALQRTSTRNLTEEQLQALIEENKSVYNVYYDQEYLENIYHELFLRLAPNYFRPEMIGFDEFPERNNPDVPLIYISNHSGMAFPWDAMVFGGGLYKLCEERNKRFVRILTAPALSETNLMNPYMLPNFWKSLAGIDATSLNFETMMNISETDVVIYPEGVPGIGKGFDKRYQLQRFSTSFIRMSLKYKTDVFPIFSINGEFINPYSYRSKFVNFLSQKVGIPYIPIGFLTLLIPIFPWIFYFGLPAGFFFVKGRRISPSKMIDKDFKDMDKSDFERVRDEVQKLAQEDLDKAVEKYGQQPYRWGDLFRRWRKNPKLFWYYFPMTWCLAFAEHHRQYKRFKKTGQPVKMKEGFGVIFSWLWHNPFYIFFLIPIIGWIPLIFKGYAPIKE